MFLSLVSVDAHSRRLATRRRAGMGVGVVERTSCAPSRVIAKLVAIADTDGLLPETYDSVD